MSADRDTNARRLLHAFRNAGIAVELGDAHATAEDGWNPRLGLGRSLGSIGNDRWSSGGQQRRTTWPRSASSTRTGSCAGLYELSWPALPFLSETFSAPGINGGGSCAASYGTGRAPLIH
jgi:hypothetical protein